MTAAGPDSDERRERAAGRSGCRSTSRVGASSAQRRRGVRQQLSNTAIVARLGAAMGCGRRPRGTRIVYTSAIVGDSSWSRADTTADRNVVEVAHRPFAPRQGFVKSSAVRRGAHPDRDKSRLLDPRSRTEMDARRLLRLVGEADVPLARCAIQFIDERRGRTLTTAVRAAPWIALRSHPSPHPRRIRQINRV